MVQDKLCKHLTVIKFQSTVLMYCCNDTLQIWTLQIAVVVVVVPQTPPLVAEGSVQTLLRGRDGHCKEGWIQIKQTFPTFLNSYRAVPYHWLNVNPVARSSGYV